MSSWPKSEEIKGPSSGSAHFLLPVQTAEFSCIRAFQKDAIEELCEKIFPTELFSATPNKAVQFFRLIIEPSKISIVRTAILDRLPGDLSKFFAVDVVTDDDSAETREIRPPTELLQTLQPPGFLPALVRLKVGAPMVLLQNLNASGGPL